MAATYGRMSRIYQAVPLAVRHAPLATLAMTVWCLTGVELYRYRFPFDLWPANLYLDETDDLIAYYAVAVMMIVSGALMLVGHIGLCTIKYAPFMRWMGYWLALGVSIVMLIGIVSTIFIDRFLWPEVLVAGTFWTMVSMFFVLAIMGAKREEFGGGDGL